MGSPIKPVIPIKSKPIRTLPIKPKPRPIIGPQPIKPKPRPIIGPQPYPMPGPIDDIMFPNPGMPGYTPIKKSKLVNKTYNTY